MNSHLQRAQLLFQQSRYELAEAELRQALAADPNDAYAHALLAMCLAEREKFPDATAEAHQAIHLEPDSPFTHYVLAQVLHDRHHNAEALAAIQEAVRLDASDPNGFALLAAVHLDDKRWTDALTAAEQGLQLDSEHVDCTNFRAIALVKLGRKAEAGATIDAALARNPDDAVTHANQGWTLLEKGNPKKALEHFRESLRLDPQNDWARQGIVEALKARNFLYAIMLKYFLLMSRFTPRVQWMIILGGYFGNQALGALARSYPGLAPWIWPIRIFYVVFALMTWLAYPLFNLMLRVNRFGRLALSREQVVASNWVGLGILLALLGLVGWIAYGTNSIWPMITMTFGLLVLPLAGTFKCPAGWPRRVMAIYTGALAAAGLGALALLLFVAGQPREAEENFLDVEKALLGFFIVGSFASTWLVNFLMFKQRRR